MQQVARQLRRISKITLACPVMMMQGINQRSYYRQWFRSMVYAALVD